ncbi:MAG TPA: dienelactone hydrolase family protein [Rhodopseudomonas sp.]|uniref:dienelactone hydrolase family protein n=1 Tax=Rhodopseudomonas sp. TaxID=1078 RepID=UPI002EDA58B6
MLCCGGPAEAGAPAPQAVDMPRSEGVLHALLYKPGGDGPFPTVIALHGCGGLSAGGAEPLRPRYAEWVDQLLKAGTAVLLPDSYGSRELGPQCRLKERRVQARRERVADIATARQWLLQQPWVTRPRISLLGWANGASALLWAVRPQSAFGGGEPDFRSAVALYPDCRLSSGLGWSARVPTLLLIGGSDDVSSPAACRQMIEGARGRSALASIVVYPGAAHGFDRLNVPLHDTDDSDSADEPDHGHVGSDPTARADAQKRVAGWLGR